MHDITERELDENEVMREKRFSEMVINQLPESFYCPYQEGIDELGF